MAASLRHDAAKRAAQDWFVHLGKGGTAEAVIVKAACKNYVKHVRDTRRDKPADDLDMRFKRWIYDDSLAGTELGKLTKTKLEAWRKALAKTPVVINRDKRIEPVTRPRAASSVNRDISALRAALNYAHDAGQVTTDLAWRVALRPTKNADGRRDAYLDLAERKALASKTAPDLALRLRGLSLVPLRPGALAAHRQFRQATGCADDRQGQGRQGPPYQASRSDGGALLRASGEQAAQRASVRSGQRKGLEQGRLEGADQGSSSQRQACNQHHGLYALRHSVITDLVTVGLDLLTVAQWSGTSVVMIERRYGHPPYGIR